MRGYDLFTLALFRSVAATGSIARAAAHHGIVASAASKRLSDLESLVGTPLLHRQRRGVELTAAGRDLLRHAKAIATAVTRMEAEMGGYATNHVGTIRVAANSSAITQSCPKTWPNSSSPIPGFGSSWKKSPAWPYSRLCVWVMRILASSRD